MSLAYLKQFESESTVRVYLVALRRFFQIIYNEDNPDVEQCVRRYFAEKRDYEQSVQAFAVAVKGVPLKLPHIQWGDQNFPCLKNHVELPQLFLEELRNRVN